MLELTLIWRQRRQVARKDSEKNVLNSHKPLSQELIFTLTSCIMGNVPVVWAVLIIKGQPSDSFHNPS